MLLLFATIITLSAAAPDRSVNGFLARNNFQVDQNDSICETPACVQSASLILTNMDSSINPCENFYQFACGKFIEETIIPDNKDLVSIFSVTKNKLQEQLRIKVSDRVEEDDPTVIKTMKSYYQMCMDTDEIEKNSESDLREVLENLGGCPVLEGSSWNETNFDWKKAVYKANKMGYDTNIFINTLVEFDPFDKTRNIIHIDQASTELPQGYYINGTNNEYVKSYLTAVIDIIALLGVNKEQAEKELRDSMEFEIELAKISLSDEERQNNFNNRMTLHQLEADLSVVAWTEYLNEILSSYAHVDQNEEVIVRVPSFLERLSGLMAKTPKRVLANYACVRAISQSMDYLGRKFLNLKDKVNRELSGTKEQPPRWNVCLKLVSEYFSTAISSLYVRHYFDKNAKTNAIDLTENLRNSLHHLIKKTDWMDETTKLAALDKLYSLVAYVGYPDELEDIEQMNGLFEKLRLHPGSFLRSQINLKQFKNRMLYSELRKPADALQWLEHSSVALVNAFYYPDDNSFDLPAGILQGQFYNADRPNYMNYGAIGSTIGHELSHAFDNLGSQYDKNGNFVDWWKKETKEEYLKKTKCFIEQYGNYTVKEVNMTIDGIKTLDENIADNLGLKAAYMAYYEWAKDKRKESRLPGLYYTPQQMFWISYANTECRKARPEKLKSEIHNYDHSHSEFRVIGPVSNLDEFSNDFECLLGSPMNPAKKCSIW